MQHPILHFLVTRTWAGASKIYCKQRCTQWLPSIRFSTLFLSNSLEFSSCRECNNEKKIIINKEKNSRDTCLRRCLCVFWFDHPGRPLHNSAIVSSECRRWKGWHRPFQKSQVQPKTGESPSWNLGAFYNRTWSQLLSNYCCIRSERD